MWYNLRNPVIQSYSMGYEQAKRDIEIKEEKTERIKSERLEELRQNEKKVLSGGGPGKRTGESSTIGGASDRSHPYQMVQRLQQFQHGRAQHQRSPFLEQQWEFRQMIVDPYHNTPRTLNAINPMVS